MIGIVGPEKLVKKVIDEASSSFLNPPASFVYHNFREVPELVAHAQKRARGMLFTGPIPYFIASASVDRKSPWTYVPYESTGLLVALLNACLSNGPLRRWRFSVDTLDENETREALRGTDLKIDALYTRPYTTCGDPSPDFLSFHKDLYRRGATDFAVTCVENLKAPLLQAGIPTFAVMAAIPTVRRTIQLLNLEVEKTSRDSMKAVVGIVAPRFRKNGVAGFDRNMLAIHQALLTWSEKHNILVVPRDHRSFRIVQNLGQLRTQTQDLCRNELFYAVSCGTGIDVDIGYGAGANIAVAEGYAERALEMAMLDSPGTAFLIDGEKTRIIGGGARFPLPSPGTAGSRVIADAGMTASSFTRYLHAITTLGASFSSSEFSKVINVTKKAGRKILSSLLYIGIIEPCGKKHLGRRGRPETLFRLVPDYERRRREIIPKERRSADA